MEYLKNIGEGVAAMLSPLGESLLGFITDILLTLPSIFGFNTPSGYFLDWHVG